MRKGAPHRRDRGPVPVARFVKSATRWPAMRTLADIASERPISGRSTRLSTSTRHRRSRVGRGLYTSLFRILAVRAADNPAIELSA